MRKVSTLIAIAIIGIVTLTAEQAIAFWGFEEGSPKMPAVGYGGTGLRIVYSDDPFTLKLPGPMDGFTSYCMPDDDCDSFFDIFVDINVQAGGGGGGGRYTGIATGHLQMASAYAGNFGGEEWYNLTITGFNISGGVLPEGVLIRESPTLVSSGQYKYKIVEGGYMVDSFFDVFTELSVDGGQTWDVPEGWSTDGGQTWNSGNVPPLHFESIPEPATLLLLGLGGVLIKKRK